MSKNSFINYLSAITALSAALKEKVYEKLDEERYRPHQILFAPGQPENRLCFIVTGFARNYYYDESGQDHTVKFWKPGDVMFSYEGYWGQPAYYYSEIMEDSTLVTLKYEDLHHLMLQFPETAVFIKTILQQFHHEENQKQRLTVLNAQQRFREMKRHYRVIFQKAPLKIIASYLNMSRETLSRMISKD